MTWSNEKTRAVYNFAHWGGGYFDVHEGHLHARPISHDASLNSSINLNSLADDIQQAGLDLPVLVRFPDILQDRVHQLNRAFAESMGNHHYHGKFMAVYPIKVNQQYSVVSEILAAADDNTQVGLECGSKPELLAVLALSTANSKTTQNTIICNGYKDRAYIRLALIGQQLGHHITIVLEKPAELTLVIEESQKLDIRPQLGLRVRLASIGKGNWQNTGGEKSKFGLSAAQALPVIEQLRDNEMLDCLQLLHCHMGSQLSNIRDIQQGLREIARYYAELHRMGTKINCVDVGGGLGIDYEGSRSRNFCSMNYSLQEYANNVVHTLWETCLEHNLPHPDIITESGRALTAHHAVLITDVIDVEKVTGHTSGTKSELEPDNTAPIILHDLWNGLCHCTEHDARAAIETYHTAAHWLTEAQSMYVHGLLTLPQKAQAEDLYFAICQHVQQQLNPAQRAHQEILDELNEKLADKVFCNFSLFQSLPDVWAIQQIFPIVPLNRLDEEPTQRAILQDITCDSDGRIDQYVDGEGIESSLPLHDISVGENYRLGIFLVGAYQEILGDIHNLFGDTNAVDVRLNTDGHYQLEHQHQGDSVETVLCNVQFDRKKMINAYQQQLNHSALNTHQQDQYLAELEAGLNGYTYFKNDKPSQD